MCVAKVNASLDAALAKIEQAKALIQVAQSTVAGEGQQAEEGGLHNPSNGHLSSVIHAHVREHRPGRPSKIDSDPELRAFILARLDHMTFEGLARAVAENFPPERRVARTTINEWWHRRIDRK